MNNQSNENLKEEYRKTLISYYGQKTNQHANYLLVLAGSAAFFFGKIMDLVGENRYQSPQFGLLMLALGIVIIIGIYQFFRFYRWGFFVDRTIKLFQKSNESIESLKAFENAIMDEFNNFHKGFKLRLWWRYPCTAGATRGYVFIILSFVWVLITVFVIAPNSFSWL